MNSRRADPVRTPAPTPDEVRSATFTQSQLAWRGYSEDEVHDFLGRVADSMLAASHERAALRAEIDRLRNFYREHGTDVDRAGPRRRRWEPAEKSLVSRIAQYADVQLERARQYATLVDERADEQAEQAYHHAKVQAALATEQAIRALVDSADGRSPATGDELRRAAVWLRAFAYAIYAQLDAANEVFKLEFAAERAEPARHAMRVRPA